MGSAARTVRRLRLRASSEAAVRRAARVLEDALRTATLPDAGGRMLFVRRLALGRLAADAQPASVALALEEAVARVGVEWRHGDEAGASESQGVWFRDPLDAHVALARRILAGGRPEAWYWTLAVPAWNRGMMRGDGVRAIAHSLAARPEAAKALPRWFAELAAGGYGGLLAAALREEDVDPLARAARLRQGREGGARGAAGDEPRESGRPQALTSGSDAIHRLIAAMLRAGGDGGIGLHEPVVRRDPMHPAELGTDPVEGARHARAGASTVAEPEAHGLSGVPEQPARSGTERPQRLLASPGDAEVVRGNGTSEARGRGAGESPALELSAQHRECPPPWLVPTSTGGLLFLLNALERVGYSEWLAAQPDWEPHEVARRVLTRTLGRLAVPAEDPGWELLRSSSPVSAPPRRFVAPSRWRSGLLTGRGGLLYAAADGAGRLYDPAGRLLLAGWHGPCPRSMVGDRRRASGSPRPPGELAGEVVHAWDIALRRWLRRFARLSAAQLVLRPATIAASPTHIDLHFDLAAADPQIRRAGLDLDPGWVWWFGRVVSFHYEPAGLS